MLELDEYDLDGQTLLFRYPAQSRSVPPTNRQTHAAIRQATLRVRVYRCIGLYQRPDVNS
jgi:hypothetical protein